MSYSLILYILYLGSVVYYVCRNSYIREHLKKKNIHALSLFFSGQIHLVLVYMNTFYLCITVYKNMQYAEKIRVHSSNIMRTKIIASGQGTGN